MKPKNKNKRVVAMKKKPAPSEKYWHNLLADFTEATPLPACKTHHTKINKKNIINITFTEKQISHLKQFCRKQNLSLQILFAATWGLLLARHTNSSDIVFGCVSDSQRVFPLRIQLDNKITTQQYLQKFCKQYLASTTHSHLSPAQIQQYSGLDKNTPLFSTVITHNKLAKNQYPLQLKIRQEKEKVFGKLHYSVEQFDKKMLSQLIEHYQNILFSIPRHTAQTVVTLPMLSKSELNTLLIKWNNTKADYPKNKTIHQLFEEQAAKTPDNIAVVFEEQQLTYQELNQKANQLAHYLRKQGVKPETLVAICVERSLEMIIGILGILKAGGAYVPIDPHYPLGRIQYMLEDCCTPIVLAQKTLCPALLSQLQKSVTSLQIIYLDNDWPIIEKENSVNPINLTKPKNLIYVIYTSGTTGKPKGVCCIHEGIINRLTWMQTKYKLVTSDRVLQKAPVSFDVSVWEIFWPLTNSANLILASTKLYTNPEYLLDIIQIYKITVLHFVPSLLQHIIDNRKFIACKTLRMVFSSGEILHYNLQHNFFSQLKAELHNLYGPTEASIDVTHWDCKKKNTSSIIPIGKPIANTQIYILDQYRQPVPINVAGEIYIGGIGLARNYLNWPNYTKEKFIKNPFSTGKLYKTGDLGCWLPNGNIEYLSRLDEQVKIRGFRVELAEIEAELTSHPAISQAAVISKTIESQDKKLIAYFTLHNEDRLTQIELKQFLSKHLPQYMLPTTFIQLKQPPLTPNGKIDKKALATLESLPIELDINYTAPNTSIERILTNVWAEILKINPSHISIHANFFALGGHSLIAIQIINRINSIYSLQLGVNCIFSTPTISSLSETIHHAMQTETYQAPNPLVELDKQQPLPLSYSQKGYWFLAKLDPTNLSLNIPILLKLQGALNVMALEQAFLSLFARHEILRTYFTLEQGEPRQIILSLVALDFKLSAEDLPNLTEAAVNKLIHQKLQIAFDLSKPQPPLKVNLLKLNHDDYRLLINIHHLISDGLSNNILAQELIQFYLFHTNQAKPPPPLPMQYIDYALQSEALLTKTTYDKQLTYWTKQLKDLPTLTLPTDYPRPPEQSFHGKNFYFEISKQLTQKLQRFAQQENTTLFIVLLSALDVLFARYSNQEDIAIGIASAGRDQQYAENLIGPLGKKLVLRSDLSDNPTFLALLQRNKTTTSNAFANQDIPFEKIIELLRPSRDLSYNPLYQAMFIFDDLQVNLLTTSTLNISSILFDNTNPDHIIPEGISNDLTFHLYNTANNIAGAIKYSTDLFKPSSIVRMTKNFKTLLNSIIEHPEENIFSLPLLTKVELKNILIDWNNTQKNYPKSKTVSRLFEEQVQKTPNSVAIVFDDKQLTYNELNQRSNQLAHYLSKQGIKKPGTLIAICVERSLEIIIAILGVLKAGAAYVPIDPAYPAARIHYMLKNCQTSIILTQQKFVSLFSLKSSTSNYQPKTINLDNKQLFEKENTRNPNNLTRSTDLIYTIYTSGSSGQPKAVLIEHGAVVNLLCSIHQELQINRDDVFLAITSIAFDISTLEFILPLITGAKCVIATYCTIANKEKFEKLLRQQKISVIQATPSVWDILLHAKWEQTRPIKILCGGEALPKHLAQLFLTKEKTFWNLYGPTETTIWSTINHVKTSQNDTLLTSIGKPIANTKIYILNKNLQPTPIGVTGEIHIGGTGLARGYLNHPTKNEKFIKSPFDAQLRLFKTGDLACWLPDGNIQYIGRLDDQIKIRGFRVEVQEIESCLLQHPNIKQVVIVAEEINANDKQLIAYIICNEKTIFNEDETRNFLKHHLPDYMIPTIFIPLAELPLTKNGKVDKNSLPHPNKRKIASTHEHTAPTTNLHKKLADIWADILQCDPEKIDIHSNFFTFGGHSLLAVKTVSKSSMHFGIELSVKDLFDAPTIDKFSRLIEKKYTQSICLSNDAAPNLLDQNNSHILQ